MVEPVTVVNIVVQMPPPEPVVKTLRVGALKPLHPGYQVRLRRLDQQVIVIAHQDIAVKLRCQFDRTSPPRW